jgi:hypothetical protein
LLDLIEEPLERIASTLNIRTEADRFAKGSVSTSRIAREGRARAEVAGMVTLYLARILRTSPEKLNTV